MKTSKTEFIPKEERACISSRVFVPRNFAHNNPGVTIDIDEVEMVCCSLSPLADLMVQRFVPVRNPSWTGGFEWHFLQIVFCPWPDHTLVPDRNHDENAHH
ncbi:MAG TPA: hypothetical protein PKG69_00370 [Methanoregulaceae archaeon]|nr:hypothetical protein [Methanoregulaceae archaeon]